MVDHLLPIGSERVSTGTWLDVRSPFDDTLLGRVPSCTADHVDQAVAIARSVHAAGPLPAWQRAEILDRAAAALAARAEEFALLIAGEAAKPIKTARVEAQRAVSTFQFAAATARTLTGDMVPMDASAAGVGKLAFTLRVPIGVVGAISPFNFPLNLVAHKLAPAIAAGCPVVLKPASQTPLSAIRLVEVLLDECGLPPGHVNVVTGSGGVVGNAIVEHPDIAMITFTGSPEVGWGIRARAARKKVGLELGNNAPVIVEPDADLALAASKIVAGGFAYSGQTCISVQRVYAHASIALALTAEITNAVEALVGPEFVPAFSRGFKGHASITQLVLEWNRRFLAQDGVAEFDLQDGRVLFKEAARVGSPTMAEPKLKFFESQGSEVAPRPFGLILNGEVLFEHIPYHQAQWHLRGEVRFPEQTAFEEIGWPAEMKTAWNASAKLYRFLIMGPLDAPQWLPVHSREKNKE